MTTLVLRRGSNFVLLVALLLPPASVLLHSRCSWAAKPSSDELRTWTDATGKRTRRAYFVDCVDGKTVTLKLEDGRLVSGPVTKFSAADQAFIRSSKSSNRIASDKEPVPLNAEDSLGESQTDLLEQLGSEDASDSEPAVPDNSRPKKKLSELVGYFVPVDETKLDGLEYHQVLILVPKNPLIDCDELLQTLSLKVNEPLIGKLKSGKPEDRERFIVFDVKRGDSLPKGESPDLLVKVTINQGNSSSRSTGLRNARGKVARATSVSMSYSYNVSRKSKDGTSMVYESSGNLSDADSSDPVYLGSTDFTHRSESFETRGKMELYLQDSRDAKQMRKDSLRNAVLRIAQVDRPGAFVTRYWPDAAPAADSEAGGNFAETETPEREELSFDEEMEDLGRPKPPLSPFDGPRPAFRGPLGPGGPEGR